MTWKRHRWTFLLALIFTLFHLFTVVATLLTARGSGEGQAYVVYFVDLPLVLLLEVMPHGGYILYNSRDAYVLFFSVAGTVMYVLLGAALGFIVDNFRTR